MICDNFSNVVQQVRAGKLKAIVVTAKTRNSQLPDVPASPDAGMPDLEAGIWYGFVAPAATPKAIVEKLNKAFVEALRDPAVVSRLEGVGMTIVADKPDEFKAFIAKESARMESIVRQSRAKIPDRIAGGLKAATPPEDIPIPPRGKVSPKRSADCICPRGPGVSVPSVERR